MGAAPLALLALPAPRFEGRQRMVDFKRAVVFLMSRALLDVAITPSRFRLALKKLSAQLSEPASHPSFRHGFCAKVPGKGSFGA